MRIHFTDLARPKEASKLLSRLDPTLKLATAQEAVARATGYRDWHDLSGASSAGPAAATNPDIDTAKTVITEIAGALHLGLGDIQYAVSKSRLLGGAFSAADQRTLLATMWRERLFGPSSRNRPGTVVKVRTHGATLPAYLQHAGRPTYILYDSGPGMCGDFETVTPRVPLPDFVPACLWLPYGYWILRDGSEILFSRKYLPLWRVVAGSVERLDPWLWIETIAEERHFSTITGTIPWSSGPARDLALRHIAERRIVEVPRLVDAMPFLIVSTTQDVAESSGRLFQRLGSAVPVPAFARLSERAIGLAAGADRQ